MSTALLCLLAGLLPTGSVSAIGSEAVLVGAGDIASCSSSGDEATANLLDTIAGTVATFGDNAYESGTTSEYNNCYDPTWGRHKARTMPVPGNHEYYTAGAAGYYSYFGAAAGDPSKGYYSYDLGAWHIVAINSNDGCTIVACGAGSAQEQWLRADLAASPRICTLAYWHHPRFSSGPHGSDAVMRPIWQALYDYGADIVISGHDHDYERFALQDPAGNADPRGIREFVVGTGGRSHYAIVSPIANSQVHNDQTYGVLKLSLHPAGYDWQFIPIAGGTFTDSGSGTCVSAAVGGITELPQPAGGGSGSMAVVGLAAVAAAVIASGLAALLVRKRTRLTGRS